MFPAVVSLRYFSGFPLPDKFVVKHLFSQTLFEGRQQRLVTEADTM